MALPFSIEIIEPTALFSIGPLYSSKLSNELDNKPSHLVNVVNNDLNHNNHLVGTLKSRLTTQLSSTIFTITHFLLPSSAITDHSTHD
jgi:hypothetical protein